jgi:murein L,D-transpeptidase YafK
MLVTLLYLFWADTLRAAYVPSSQRAKTVIDRVKPQLTQQLARKGMALGDPILVRTFKKERKLEVWVNTGLQFELFKTYQICNYSGMLGPKLYRGDGQAPEGVYVVTPGRMNPSSQYHLSFDVGYPNRLDRQHHRTGSSLMIHGGCKSRGCYAMTNANIEEIYTLADAAFRRGQKNFQVHAYPFRMTYENLTLHRGHRWYGFWQDLKAGYDFFERTRQLPDMVVKGGRYVLREGRPETLASLGSGLL